MATTEMNCLASGGAPLEYQKYDYTSDGRDYDRTVTGLTVGKTYKVIAETPDDASALRPCTGVTGATVVSNTTSNLKFPSLNLYLLYTELEIVPTSTSVTFTFDANYYWLIFVIG